MKKENYYRELILKGNKKTMEVNAPWDFLKIAKCNNYLLDEVYVKMVMHLYFDYSSKYILKLHPKSMKTVCEKMKAKYIYLQYNRVCLLWKKKQWYTAKIWENSKVITDCLNGRIECILPAEPNEKEVL